MCVYIYIHTCYIYMEKNQLTSCCLVNIQLVQDFTKTSKTTTLATKLKKKRWDEL